MDTFIGICEKHGIKPLFVFFDDCWNENAKIGKQMEPTPGLHNSGWLQSPGSKKGHSKEYRPTLEKYIKGVLTYFTKDSRIFGWDLYNEPGSGSDGMLTMSLLVDTFKWAREINPSQPLTSGVWANVKSWKKMIQFQLDASDFISFHNYDNAESMKKDIDRFKSYNRPAVCTEYMARGRKSTFENIMPILKEANIGAINWGFVDGKTQTKYPWGSPIGAKEPNPWHHEIFHSDYTPYSASEIAIIKKCTEVNN